MGRLTALLLATSAGLLVLAGAQRLLPRLPGQGTPGRWRRRRPEAPPAAPFGAVRSPAWSTTDAMVSRLQARLQQQPEDAPAYAQLASLYLQKARETGDPGLLRQGRGGHPGGRQAQRRTTPWPSSSAAPCSWPATTSPGPCAAGSGRCAVAPRSAAGYGVVGDAALELGQYERAVEAFQAMIDLRPDLASYSRVAYARELHGDLPGAIEAMQRAVNAGAPRTEGANWARVQLGHLYFLSGDLEGAERQYGQALQLLPDYVHALAGQGRVAAARGDLAQAIQRYTRALELTPLPEFAIALGDLYRATGDLPAAQRQDDLVRVIARLQRGAGWTWTWRWPSSRPTGPPSRPLPALDGAARSGPGPTYAAAPQRRRRRRPGLDALPAGERGGGPPLRPRGPAPGQPRPALPVPRRGGGAGCGGAGGGADLPGSLPRGEPRVLRALRPGGPAPLERAGRGQRTLMARRGPFKPFRPLKALLASLGAGAALVLGTLVAPGPVALAHPLGNFTVNRYARVEVSPPGTARSGALRLRYVVDLAEIPTFQALPTIDVNGDGTISQAEGDSFARRTAEASLPGLALTVDGRPVPLRIVSSEASFLPGQAGLQTALVGAWLEATDASALGLGARRGQPARAPQARRWSCAT